MTEVKVAGDEQEGTDVVGRVQPKSGDGGKDIIFFSIRKIMIYNSFSYTKTVLEL